MPRGPRSLKVDVSLRKRIRAFKGHKKDSAVCALLGISQQTLTRIMSGRELRLSERVLTRIADVLGTSTGFLTASQTDKTPHAPKRTQPLPESHRLIGEALLAHARGDHQHALDSLAGFEGAALDSFLFVAHRFAAARAHGGLAALESAEHLLREAIAHLEEGQGSALLKARCALELALLLARREKTLDAIEAFALAERILEELGAAAFPHLFHVRQCFLRLALRIGHHEHALRILKIRVDSAKKIEGDGCEGLGLLNEALMDALATKAAAAS